MEQIKHPLQEVCFTGGRFEQTRGWLDFDVLPELLVYRRLLIETAKEEWKRANPGRERLPKGFGDNVRLGFAELRGGSCTVLVERIVEVADDGGARYVPDEVDQAVQLIDETLVAAAADAPFPDRLPARVIPLFEDWGRTLAADEGMVLGGPNGPGLRFDAAIRERILRAQGGRYEDVVDVTGEVRAAELKAREGGSFTVLLANGAVVSGMFTDEQERCVTAALHGHRELRLRLVGRGEFAAAGQLRRILRVDQLEERPLGETPFDAAAPPIWETIAGLGRAIAEDEWDKVPRDLAANLDRYLYGEPKERGQ